MQLSDSFARVSEQMAELAMRAKAAEKHTAEACAQTREEIDGRISELKADSRRRRSEIQLRQAEARDELATWWSTLGATLDEQRDKIGSQIDQRRADHDAKVVERRADRAEANAADAIWFAIYVVGAAEVAVLEAAKARSLADARLVGE
jgi:hypothetical protein